MQFKITLKSIYTALFFLGLFFIPFNDFEGLSFLGEYKDESATYFFLIGFLVLIIESILRGKISIPYKDSLAIVLLCFIGWTFVSSLLNIDTILSNYYKQTSGLSRYIRQTISLLISAVIFTILFWNVIKNYSFDRIFKLIRKTFLFSLIFVAVYGFIEIGIVHFGMGFLTPLYEVFEIFPFVNTNFEHGKRISSVAFEVPSLGNYLITITPWMFSYILTGRNIFKFLPSLVVLTLMYFSDSRTALICILIQMVVFILILLHDVRFRKATSILIKVGGLGLFLIILLNSEAFIKTINERADRINFSKNLTENISNKSRFGMQYASLQVFKENPIVGVGLGQDTYHKIHHYPYWATHKNWEFELKYQNQNHPPFPPAYNLYTRTLSELGIIGFLILITFIFLCFYYSILYWKMVLNKYKYIGLILIVSFTGLFVNWMQADFFRQYGVWLCLVLLIKCRLDFNQEVFSTTIDG